MEQRLCPETSVTNNLPYVTTQDSEDFIYTAAEALNHARYIPLFTQKFLKQFLDISKLTYTVITDAAT
jgi:hypothetical protein